MVLANRFCKSKVSALEHRAPLAFTKFDMATAVLGERLGVRPTAGDALLRLRHCFVLPPTELALQLAFLTVRPQTLEGIPPRLPEATVLTLEAPRVRPAIEDAAPPRFPVATGLMAFCSADAGTWPTNA